MHPFDVNIQTLLQFEGFAAPTAEDISLYVHLSQMALYAVFAGRLEGAFFAPIQWIVGILVAHGPIVDLP